MKGKGSRTLSDIRKTLEDILSPQQEKVPVIDFAKFLKGSEVQQREVSLKVMTALEDYGQRIIANQHVQGNMMTDILDEVNQQS